MSDSNFLAYYVNQLKRNSVMKPFLLAAIVAIFITGSPRLFASNLITNGDFEAGFTGAPHYRYLSNGEYSTIPSWTASDDGIGERSYIMSRTGYPAGVVDGNYSVFMNQGTAISTTVALIAGQAYQLSFFAKKGGNKLADPLQLWIGSYKTTINPVGYENINFISSDNSPNAILKFYNSSPVGDFRGYVLDSVSLTAVPLPGVVWLFGTAMVGLGLIRKRHMSEITV